MNTIDNSKIQNTDISLGLLLETLETAKDLPLVFHYDGRSVKGGYHVTEVKAGQFAALDCGANPEAWTEIFVQLWDIDGDERTHMPAGKFAAIIRKVSEHVKLEGSAKLTFEVSDGVQPMQLYQADCPSLRAGQVHIELAARPASCKPRDRWLAEETTKAAACCSASALQRKRSHAVDRGEKDRSTEPRLGFSSYNINYFNALIIISAPKYEFGNERRPTSETPMKLRSI